MNDIDRAVAVQKEMTKEISELKKFEDNSIKFYDKKIDEIKGLSNKLGKYRPMEQLEHITQKLSLSENTSQLIRSAMRGKGQ